MTLPENWTPSENMKAALEWATDKEWFFEVTTLCEAIGISREAYYDWFRNARFVAWWGSEWERYFALRMPKVWRKVDAALGRPGSETNMAAAKLLAERFDKGFAPRSRQDIAADVAVRKTYVNVDTERVTGIRAEDEDGRGQTSNELEDESDE